MQVLFDYRQLVYKDEIWVPIHGFKKKDAQLISSTVKSQDHFWGPCVFLLFVTYRVILLIHTKQLLKVNPALKCHNTEFIGLKICNIQYFNKVSVFYFMHLYVNKSVFKSFMGCVILDNIFSVLYKLHMFSVNSKVLYKFSINSNVLSHPFVSFSGAVLHRAFGGSAEM